MNWVLLRGLAREHGHWGDFYTLMEKSKGTQKVLSLDLPGMGDQHKRTSPETIREITDDLRTRWQQSRGDTSPWALLAISLGGMVALDWLARFENDFAQGVIINSSGRGVCPFYQRLRPQMLPTMIRIFISDEPRVREPLIYDMTSNIPEKKQITVKSWVDIASRRPVQRENAKKQLKAASQFQVPSNVSTPITVLCSKADRLVHPQCSRAIAKKYGATLVEHDTAGHDLTLDAPTWVLDQLL